MSKRLARSRRLRGKMPGILIDVFCKPTTRDKQAIYAAAMGSAIAYRPVTKGTKIKNYQVASLRQQLETVFGKLKETPVLFRDKKHDLFAFGAIGEGAILVAWRGSRGTNAGFLKKGNSRNWVLNYNGIGHFKAKGFQGFWVSIGDTPTHCRGFTGR